MSCPLEKSLLLNRTNLGVVIGCVVTVLWSLTAIDVTLARQTASPPVSIIYDTDIGNDIDDAMALSMIHALQSLGECKLLAVTITKDNPYAGSMVDVMNTFYGRGGIPIGTSHTGFTPEDGNYNRAVCTALNDGQLRYPHQLRNGGDAPEAVEVLRKTLAAQPDGSVVIVQVGFSTNLARLLDSKADAISPFDGPELVRSKVRLLSAMAGRFVYAEGEKRLAEYNINIDIKSAQRVLHHWPTPVVVSGYEVGRHLMFPGASIEQDYGYVLHHPLVDAYKVWDKVPYDPSTYDLTSVLYAVRPDAGYFGLSQAGRVIVEDEGTTRFEPAEGGRHHYLTVSPLQKSLVRDVFVELCRRPPDRFIVRETCDE